MTTKTQAIAIATAIALSPLSLLPAAYAHAAPQGVDAYAYENTVNLTDLPDIDSYPVCRMEDGSDVAPALLPCVWTNDGNAWLTYEDRSFLIIDNTVVGPNAYDMGAYVGGYN